MEEMKHWNRKTSQTLQFSFFFFQELVRQILGMTVMPDLSLELGIDCVTFAEEWVWKEPCITYLKRRMRKSLCTSSFFTVWNGFCFFYFLPFLFIVSRWNGTAFPTFCHSIDVVKVDLTCRTTTTSGSFLCSQVCLYLHCPAGDKVKKTIYM